MEFLEDLNIPNMICPPTEAVPGRFVVYRLVDNIPIKIEDIWSYRALYPAKVFKINECQVRACSVYSKYLDAIDLQKVPNFKEKRIVRIDIVEKDGVFLKTSSKSHFSWWISREFDLTAVKEAV